jgi:hypothetical protein
MKPQAEVSSKHSKYEIITERESNQEKPHMPVLLK